MGNPPVWFQTVPCWSAAGEPTLTTRPPKMADDDVTVLNVGESTVGTTGAAVVVLRQPAFVAFMLLLFFPWQLTGVILVGTLTGYLISRPFTRKQVQAVSEVPAIGD